MRFLLVDDDRADAGLLREAMAQAAPDVQVDVAQTAQAAMMRLRRPPRIDLVLLDLNMPGEHGLSILERIRADPQTNGVPVIVLTTSAASHDVHRAYELHANAFVTKPADLHATIDAMRRLCDFWCTVALLPGAP